MKKSLFILLLGLLGTIAVRADLVMELNLGGSKLKVVVKIKEEKIRYDILPEGGYGNTSRIADLKTGDDFNLDYPPRRIIKNSPVAPNQTNTVAKTVWPNFQDTGKTETVNGYEAEVYNGTNSDGMVETLWVAKDFPNFEKIKHDLTKLDQLNIGKWMPELSPLSGMPLKLALFLDAPNGKAAVPLTLISAKEEAVDASTFNAPTNFHNWYGPLPDGDFFRAMREVPNYSVNLDLNNPTNYTGIPATKWFPSGSYEFCSIEGTVTTQIKLPDGKAINEDFHNVDIDRDHDGILKIRVGSLGWLKTDKASSRPQRELNNWASGVFSADQFQEKQTEVQHWMATWTGQKDQFEGFFVKRPGYTLNFSFVGGVREEDGFAYIYELTFREPKSDIYQFPTGNFKRKPNP